MDPEKMKEGMEAWQSWIGMIAAQGKLISTKPIVWEGTLVRHKTTEAKPAILEGLMVTGYLLCKAASDQEVQEWSKSCPILHSPDGFTEIREIAPFEL